MGSFEPRDILCGRYLAREYDEELISSLLDLMVPENCRIRFTSKDYAGLTDKKEPWYGTPYKQEPMTPKFVERLKAPVTINPLLKLPKKNIFIAEDFSLRREEEARKANPDFEKRRTLVVEGAW